jgi:esterase/lipase
MTADRDPAGIMPGAEPFFFRGGAVGCLVLHGWTGSTQEVRALGAHLATQGYTVFGPRLTHHGTALVGLVFFRAGRLAHPQRAV